jgi:beta-xylosidase
LKRITQQIFSINIVKMLSLVMLCVLQHSVNSQSVAHAQTSFRNPVLWEDLADGDVLRVGNQYYYSASNMHYSPGAPVLSSTDLVHWNYIGHSVPVLDFGPSYDLNGGSAYVRGTWASFLGYRKSNQTFYWGGCIDFNKTYIYTAKAAEGPWQRHAILNKCYYDAGFLVDDDDTIYISYGNTTLHVAQLSADATKEVRSETVFTTPKEIGTLEGSRIYRVQGNYYIFTTKPADAEYVLKSTSGPFGPYTARVFVKDAVSPVTGAGHPHQGGIVETATGAWYYMAFIDAYPGGRLPVLAPMHWNADGWPELELQNGAWGNSYPLPVIPATQTNVVPFSDSFHASTLGPEWEWNHNPDNTKWLTGRGLLLETATVTDDLYLARNTLTHRIPGPESTATVSILLSQMKDGDNTGLAMLRDTSAWVGVVKEKGSYNVILKTNLTMREGWKTANKGDIDKSIAISGDKIWLRVSADIRPGVDRQARFFYSTDGRSFQAIGNPVGLNNSWNFFMGYRFSIFNYATQSLGGKVLVSSFDIFPSELF